MCQAPLSYTISWSLLKFMSIESVMLSTYLILCHPLLLLFSIFASIRVFSKESVLLIRWPCFCYNAFSHTLRERTSKNFSLLHCGLPRWLSSKEYACNAKDVGAIPVLKRSPWRRKWQPKPVFLPGKSHGQRSLMGYLPSVGQQRVGHN